MREFSAVNINFLTGEKALLEKELLEKSATIKRFEYSPLGSQLKKTITVYIFVINTKNWLIIFLYMDWKTKICISQIFIMELI